MRPDCLAAEATTSSDDERRGIDFDKLAEMIEFQKMMCCMFLTASISVAMKSAPMKMFLKRGYILVYLKSSTLQFLLSALWNKLSQIAPPWCSKVSQDDKILASRHGFARYNCLLMNSWVSFPAVEVCVRNTETDSQWLRDCSSPCHWHYNHTYESSGRLKWAALKCVTWFPFFYEMVKHSVKSLLWTHPDGRALPTGPCRQPPIVNIWRIFVRGKIAICGTKWPEALIQGTMATVAPRSAKLMQQSAFPPFIL